MSRKLKHVWYASYGSNLLESRFLCYILGGLPEGAQKTNPGCTDKSLPLDSKKIAINSELYFAKHAKRWDGGGVGFIDPELNDSVETYGRMYLITTEQFIEVVKQENHYTGDLAIDFQKAQEEGSLIVQANSWYGKLLYLGDQEGHPIFTFTNENVLSDEINPPSEPYLLTLVNGLKDTYGLNESELKAYFESKLGIKGFEIEERIAELLK
ncbi:MAG: hypothetical protein ACQERC_04490 [Bacteroidota bacterium]